MKVYKIRSKIKIEKLPADYLLTLIGFALLCIPFNNAGFPVFTKVLKLATYLSFFWSIIVFFKSRLFLKKWYYPLWILLIFMLISTAINDVSTLRDCIICVIRMYSITVLYDFLMRYNARKAIIWNAAIWTVLMFVQAFSEITACFGYTHTINNPKIRNFLFGIRTDINQYIIYAIFFCFIAAYIGNEKEKIELIITLVSGFYFIIAQKVSTSIVGVAIFFAVLIGSKIVKNKVLWRSYIAVIAVGIFIFIRFQNTEIFQKILVNWLKEDLSLNGRVYLWTQAIEQARGVHALIGFGYSPKFTLQIGTYVVNHPHNQYLQFIFNYGYPGLMLYLLMMINSIKNIFHTVDYKIRMICIAAFSATAVICISSRNYFYLSAQIFYVMLLHINDISSESK